MSFDVHAVGSNGFRFSRNDNPDGDIFEAAAVMSAMRASSPSRVGVAEGVADYFTPSEAGAFRVAVGGVARLEFLHLLDTAVTLLAADVGVRQGWIAVYARESNTLWADTSGFARYGFTPGYSPGTEFIRRVTPALVTVEMNNYGVLRILAEVISRYHTHLRRVSGPPMLQVQLFS